MTTSRGWSRAAAAARRHRRAQVMGPQDVVFVDRLLGMLEARHRVARKVGIKVLNEEIEALNSVEEIAAASPRVEALIFGMDDYAASQGMRVSGVGETDDHLGDLYHYHRNRIAIAARIKGSTRSTVRSPIFAIRKSTASKRAAPLCSASPGNG